MSESNQNIRLLDDIKYSPVGQGNTADILGYSDTAVLKLFHEEMPFDAIEHEWLNTVAVQDRFENIPKALEFVKYKERYGIIYERITGSDMMNFALTQPHKHKEFGEILADLHLKMNEISVPLPDELKQKLERDIRNGIGLTDDEKNIVIAILDDLPRKSFLCHFDFHPGNVMIAEDEYYVIDWMTACSGDPAADVARFLLLMTFGEPLYADNAKHLLLSAGMSKIKKSYTEKYMLESGIDYSEVESWMVPVAAARLSELLTDHERGKLIELVREAIQ